MSTKALVIIMLATGGASYAVARRLRTKWRNSGSYDGARRSLARSMFLGSIYCLVGAVLLLLQIALGLSGW